MKLSQSTQSCARLKRSSNTALVQRMPDSVAEKVYDRRTDKPPHEGNSYFTFEQYNAICGDFDQRNETLDCRAPHRNASLRPAAHSNMVNYIVLALRNLSLFLRHVKTWVEDLGLFVCGAQ